jgi:hypothetical protein
LDRHRAGCGSRAGAPAGAAVSTSSAAIHTPSQAINSDSQAIPSDDDPVAVVQAQNRAAALGSDFLPLEHHVTDDEQQNGRGHQTDDLRPDDENTLQQRKRARYGSAFDQR